MILIAIIIEIASFIGLVYLYENNEDTPLISGFLAIIFIISLIIIHILICQKPSTAPVSHEYPSDEYILEYKVTTIEEKCDTTYVLTKIKTD